jgi:hypothetical protein
MEPPEELSRAMNPSLEDSIIAELSGLAAFIERLRRDLVAALELYNPTGIFRTIGYPRSGGHSRFSPVLLNYLSSIIGFI